MTKQFSRYSLVGVFNTLVHWLVFALMVWLGMSQAWSNGLAFLLAASFSYWVNSHFTFQKAPKKRSYTFFLLGMGAISVMVGALGDFYQWPGLVTLVSFSALSLFLGFAWSKWVVFRH